MNHVSRAESLSHYEGEERDGKPFGIGRGLFDDGSGGFQWMFSGEWKDGLMDGTGTLVAVYDRAEDRRLEPQLLTMKPGDPPPLGSVAVTGRWSAGHLQPGNGSITLLDGETFEGKWTDIDGSTSVEPEVASLGFLNRKEVTLRGESAGFGLVLWIGQAYSDKFTGSASFVEYQEKHWAVYEGEFENGEFVRGSGRGSEIKGPLAWNKENARIYGRPWKYEGAWRNWLPHGRGRKSDISGEYEGELAAGIPHGEGTRSKWGTTYTGGWIDGKRSGFGRERREAEGRGRNEFVGEWLDDWEHGKGIRSYEDGWRIEGIWKRGSLNGPAVITLPDGSAHETLWMDDVVLISDPTVDEKDFAKRFALPWKKFPRYYKGPIVNGLPEGIGVMEDDLGFYEGHFKEGFRSGYGVMQFHEKTYIRRDWDGVRYEGEWSMGFPDGKGKATYPWGLVDECEWVGGHPRRDFDELFERLNSRKED